MPIKILMPALSPTMTEGNLAKWLKKEGDKVKSGDVIAEVETDKATMEMEAADEGVLAKILIPEGAQNVPINSLIAIILEEGEEADAALDLIVAEAASPTKSSSSTVAENVNIDEVRKHEVVVPDVKEGQVSSAITRVFASPLARRIAADKGIDLKNITGSGPHGRIIKADLAQNTNMPKPRQATRNNIESNITPHTNIRRIIARRLLESKQTVPHFYLSIECKLDKLLDLRAEMNNAAGNPSRYKLSVNDFIIKASAFAMQEVPMSNASWSDEGMVIYNNVDISVAVAGPNGLVTPILKNADLKSLPELSNEMKELAKRARENKLRPEEFQGGGFTISNLGMFGIKNFSAIINPPQSCILAIGEGSKRAIVEGDEIAIATIMDVTLSCDHRIVDGAVGAQFLSKFKDYIESPIKMLMKEMSI